MIRLDSTSRKLQAVLAGAVTTNQLHCVVSYSDHTSTAYNGGTQLTSTNSTTAVDICDAPAASTVRDIDYINIRNRDTAAATVTVMLDSSGADSEIAKAILSVGDQLVYTHGEGWKTLASDGTLKSGTGLGYTPVNKAGDTMTGLLTFSAGADIASAATIDLTAATGNVVRVTGTTTTTNVTINNGQVVWCYAVGAWPLTHHATNLPLPGSANYTCSAGDLLYFSKDGNGDKHIQIYKADGTAVASGGKFQDFRLTLTTGVPVTTSDVTGATTIYCTPYKGNQISLYTGSAWVTRTSAEFSLAIGTLTSGKPYDVFCYDNGGTPTLEFLVWTNDTTRATALAYQDGVLVKSGAATRRYLGTFYTTGTTTTEDSVANRYLWNYYHRADRPMVRKESTSTWTYTTNTWRQANASTSNQLNFLVGVAEDCVFAHAAGAARNASAQQTAYVGIGVDVTNANSATLMPNAQIFYSATHYVAVNAEYYGNPSAGRHYLAWLEIDVTATGTTTWAGTDNSSQSGIHGVMKG